MIVFLLMTMEYNKCFLLVDDFRRIDQSVCYESLIDDDSLVYYLIEMFLPPCYER